LPAKSTEGGVEFLRIMKTPLSILTLINAEFKFLQITYGYQGDYYLQYLLAITYKYSLRNRWSADIASHLHEISLYRFAFLFRYKTRQQLSRSFHL